MTAPTTRDALAKVLSHHEQREGPARGARYCVCGEWRYDEEWSAHVADALLASGAVIDTATLAGNRETFCFDLAPLLADTLEVMGVEDADLSDGKALADTIYCLGYRRVAAALSERAS